MLLNDACSVPKSVQLLQEVCRCAVRLNSRSWPCSEPHDCLKLLVVVYLAFYNFGEVVVVFMRPVGKTSQQRKWLKMPHCQPRTAEFAHAFHLFAACFDFLLSSLNLCTTFFYSCSLHVCDALSPLTCLLHSLVWRWPRLLLLRTSLLNILPAVALSTTTRQSSAAVSTRSAAREPRFPSTAPLPLPLMP